MRKSLVMVGLFLLLVVKSFSDVEAEESFPKEALPTASGYLSIKEKPGAFMFYAFYEAIHIHNDIPIVLWLDGGPACSSMGGNFYETGPWIIGQDHRLHRNSAPWNRLFGLLFVDNPVGSGYSIAPTDQHIPRNVEEVTRDLYSALQTFFGLNPLFRSRPLYVVGQSYSGKHASSLAYYMVRKLDKGEAHALRIDGLAIGDGWVDPIIQIQWFASAAYALGLIDFQQKLHLEKLQQEAAALVREKKWKDAAIARIRVFGWLENATGVATITDVRRKVPYDTAYLTIFLNQRAVNEALKVDVKTRWERCNAAAEKRMVEDSMKSSKWQVQRVVRRMPVLLYEGQFDLGCAVSTEEWMRTMDWDGLSDFWGSERRIWKESEVLAGYVRSYSNLTHVVVARAGHLAPADQTIYCQKMIDSWVHNYIPNSLHFQSSS